VAVIAEWDWKAFSQIGPYLLAIGEVRGRADNRPQ
jgi:hypothetical protein